MTFDHKQLARLADWAVVAVAVALPWSTSATSILLIIWLIALIPTLDAHAIRQEIQSPAGGLPVLLWFLGTVGMVWADVSWSERFGGLGSFHRLLTIPLLLAQFRRSENARWALYGFLASAVALLMASWTLVFGLMFWQTNHFFGVVVHDVIAQSTIFLVSAAALIWPVRDLVLERNWRLTLCCTALATLFLANILFLAASRADIVVLPVLVVLLGWRRWSWRGALIAFVATGFLAAGLFASSSHLRARVQSAINDVETYRTTHVHNDVGDHLEFIKKSIAFIREAPVLGHGTGSIGELFRRSAVGQSGAAAVVSVNPHNQILAVAIQIGLVGAAVLVAMWLAHFLLFHGTSLVAWIGTVIVVENVISSLSSSHLFDFVHGWLYVLGVGLLGGVAHRDRPGLRLRQTRPVSDRT